MAVGAAAVVVVVDAEEPVEAVTTATARPALRMSIVFCSSHNVLTLSVSTRSRLRTGGAATTARPS